MPFVSIIIPVYNTGEDIRQCLDTIRQQTFGDYEVILVDDGSSNGTERICDKYVEMDIRFRVLHQKNAGVATARNNGIEMAQGQWITFVDSDDWLDVHYLQGLADCANEGTDVVVCDSAWINADHEIYWKNIDRQILSNKEQSAAETVIKHMPHSMWSYMFRRECLNGVRVDTRLHFYEDLDFLLQVFREPLTCSVNSRGGYHYRQGSVTHRKLTHKTLTAFDVVDKQRKEGLPEPLCLNLEQKMLMSVAFVGAEDPVYSKEHNAVLRKRAVDFRRRSKGCSAGIKIKFYNWLLACSPRLFYCLQHAKSVGK